jgi:hypothetical protein
MTAWFKKASSPADEPTELLSADANWARALRDGQAPVSLGDHLDFQTILNEFDADHDGWAELLVHSYDAHSYEATSSQSASTTIAPYLYTDKGLVPLKSPLRRDAQSPEACLDP